MLVCEEDGEIVHEDANACFFAQTSSKGGRQPVFDGEVQLRGQIPEAVVEPEGVERNSRWDIKRLVDFFDLLCENGTVGD